MKIDSLLNFYHCPSVQDIHPIAAQLDLSTEEKIAASSMFRLIDAPPCGQGIVHMHKVIELLFEASASETGLCAEALSDLALKTWGQIDSMLITKPEWSSSKPKKVRMTHPIYTFCFHGCAVGKAFSLHKAGFSAVFKVLGPFLLKRLWQLRSESDDIYGPSLAARKLGVMPIELHAVTTLDPNAMLLTRVAKSAQDAEINGKKFFTSNDLLFARRLLVHEISKTNRDGSSSPHHVEDRIERWTAFEREQAFSMNVSFCDDSDLFQSEMDGFTPELNEITQAGEVQIIRKTLVKGRGYEVAGEHESDYDGEVVLSFPAHWFDAWKAKRGERGKIEAMTFASVVMPWDRSCISPDMMRRIFDFSLGSLRNNAGGIIWLILLMGLTVERIRGLVWLARSDIESPARESLNDLIDGECFIDPHTGCMWAVSERSAEDRLHYYNTDDITSIQLPEMIAERLPRMAISGEKVFSESDLKTFARALKSLGIDGVAPVSISRLRKTFQAYFVCGGGFPALWADALAFQPSYFLRSQHYYVTYSLDALVSEWHRMADAFLSGIRNQSPIRTILEDMCFDRETLALNSDARCGGARGTPTMNAVKEHFRELADHIPDSKQELIYASDSSWNAYMGYLYGCYEITTGQRPMRDPDLRIWRLQMKLRGVYVSDKNNGSYTEARFLPLCQTTSEMLRIYLRTQKDWLERKMSQGYTLDGPLGGFHLADAESKALVPYSQNKLDELLGGVVGDGYLRNIRNGFRHFLLTQLHAAGVKQPTIDFLAGHRHCGMEPEFWASPIQWALLAKGLMETIEGEIIQPLGLMIPIHG